MILEASLCMFELERSQTRKLLPALFADSQRAGSAIHLVNKRGK